ncbi:MAG: S8 family peptidase, partial [Rufibacter sp.]
MAYAAWDITKGDSNVVIGILDTGVRLTHEDLQDKIKYNYADPIDGLDNDKDGYTDNFQGWDLADADNAPTADASGHGTSVAAIAAAHADNGKGMAGVGFKCKFLPVKIYASNSGSGSFKGYEGIVYAADHGCSVINLSWGGAGYPSAFEQDIINYAVLDKNVVIIAAAGNTNAELDFYPASYQNVVSVGGVGSDDIKTATHTYSYNIDISALSTRVYTAANENNSHYVNASGTSMSAPIVSGAAALVRSHYKDLTAQQIGELLRATADDIYAVPGNENYLEKLGKGRLNIKRALTETNAKSVRVIDWNLVDKTANKPGAVFEVKTTYQNFLSPLSDLRVSVTTSSPYIQVINGLQTVGSMATLGKANNEVAPFRFKIAENTPPNTEVALRVGFTDGSFTDYQYLKLVLHPDFVTTDVNHVVASVTSRGNLAYDGYDFKIGHGVSYKSSEPLLAEGGLLVGYSPPLVSDNVRNEKGTTDKDFYTVSVFNRIANSSNAPFEAFSLLEDSLTTGKPKSLQIRQNVYAWADEPNKDFILLEYVLTNRTTAPIAQAFAGIYADWDIIAAGSNLTEWDSPHKLGIIRHTTDKSIWAGIQVLG